MTSYQKRRVIEEALRQREFSYLELANKIGSCRRTAVRIVNELSSFLPVKVNKEDNEHRFRIC